MILIMLKMKLLWNEAAMSQFSLSMSHNRYTWLSHAIFHHRSISDLLVYYPVVQLGIAEVPLDLWVYLGLRMARGSGVRPFITSPVWGRRIVIFRWMTAISKLLEIGR